MPGNEIKLKVAEAIQESLFKSPEKLEISGTPETQSVSKCLGKEHRGRRSFGSLPRQIMNHVYG